MRSFAFDAVDGTANWGPTDLSHLTIGDPLQDLTVFLSGSAAIKLSYRTSAGEIKQDNATGLITGHADISVTPPRLELS